MGNTGGSTNGARRGGGGGHEAALGGGSEIWLSADVTWVAWLGGVPDWALVGLGLGDVGGLVSLAVDDDNDDDDNFDTDDDRAGSDGWGGVWWCDEDGGGGSWSGGGGQDGGWGNSVCNSSQECGSCVVDRGCVVIESRGNVLRDQDGGRQVSNCGGNGGGGLTIWLA